jgi:hypothetical protein
MIRFILKQTILALLFVGCSAPVEPATVPNVVPFQPADLPKTPIAQASQDELTPGTWVEITDIKEGDPFFQTKAKLVGRRCVVWGKGLEGDEGVYRGNVRCDRDADFFLTKATLGVLKEGNIGPQSQPGKVFTGEEVAPGKRVKILGFSYEDQLFPWPKELTSRGDIFLRKYGNLVGKTCEVASEPPLSVMSFLGKIDAKPSSSSTSAPASTSAPVATKPASQEGPKGLFKTGEDWYGGVLLCKQQDKDKEVTVKVFVYQAWIEVL